jgi:hypothetical protein
MYPARRFVLAHPVAVSKRLINNAISVPLDCVAAVPPKATKKKNAARVLDSKECRKVYAEIIAITGQIKPRGATAPP